MPNRSFQRFQYILRLKRVSKFPLTPCPGMCCLPPAAMSGLATLVPANRLGILPTPCHAVRLCLRFLDTQASHFPSKAQKSGLCLTRCLPVPTWPCLQQKLPGAHTGMLPTYHSNHCQHFPVLSFLLLLPPLFLIMLIMRLAADASTFANGIHARLPFRFPVRLVNDSRPFFSRQLCPICFLIHLNCAFQKQLYYRRVGHSFLKPGYPCLEFLDPLRLLIHFPNSPDLYYGMTQTSIAALLDLLLDGGAANLVLMLELADGCHRFIFLDNLKLECFTIAPDCRFVYHPAYLLVKIVP